MDDILSFIIKPAIAASNVIGTINAPAGIPSQPADTGNLISAIVRFMMVLGGLFTFWQFLSGGLQFITSGGDKSKISEGQNKIQMSIVGLVIMTASLIIISIVSKILFDDFTTILFPKLTPI